jgi:hypothetical protein
MINKFTSISDAKKNILSVFLIAILAIIIYSNTFHASFHFDDHPAIVENYSIHRFDVKEILFNSSRPILNLTFALNYYFGKLNVFGYHLVNLILHIANGILLYFILFLTINRIIPTNPRNPSNTTNSTNPINPINSSNFRIPLYASLIFISHPIQTQAVTYIISRSSVLATSFYLLALLLFIKAFKLRAESEEHLTQPSKLYLGCAVIASCLAMGTKQIAVTLPLMILVYDFYFVSNGNLKLMKSRWKFHLLMFSTIAIVIYLSLSGLKLFVSFDYAKGVPMPQTEPITSFQYFLTQLHVIPYYIKLLFVPVNLNLDYDWPITRSIDFSTMLYFVLLMSIVIIAIVMFRRAKLVSFGIVWFFVTLSVTSSFIVIYDVIFEHRLYLPSVGFCIVIAFLISKISEIRTSRGSEQ